MTSYLRIEALQSSDVVDQQLKQNQKIISELAAEVINQNPNNLITIARGSSDHAASFVGYLNMITNGMTHSSLSMSAITIHKAKIKNQNSLALTISQSGKSPDLIEPIEYFKQIPNSNVSNNVTIGLINRTDSPLAKAVKYLVPLYAGEERSIAATKSFISSLTAGVHLFGSIAKNRILIEALFDLPTQLTKAQKQSWSDVIDTLKNQNRIMVIGRCLGLPIASEMALKFKEVCGIQAEAFSSAEVKHGPMAIIEPGYVLFVIAPKGREQNDLLKLASDMKVQGANVILAADENIKERDLTIISTEHEYLDYICAIQSFYLLIDELSKAKGLNPDKPQHLQKVTLTR